mmetsp:Transcript_61108/g.145579  ORF Transcript_61108/g.145579 Transcript_61108/m.145579 type:complete len:282 (+) Transcript_61108:1458-2303(+)
MANSASSSSKVNAPASTPGAPLMTCWKARPKEMPTSRARRSKKATLSSSDERLASECTLEKRSSKDAKPDIRCDKRSVHMPTNRSSRPLAAAVPHSVEGGRVSPDGPRAAAAPKTTVRCILLSNRRQISSEVGSRQTSILHEAPRYFVRSMSVRGWSAPPVVVRSGRSMTSMFAHPGRFNLRNRGSDLSLVPRPAATACESERCHCSAVTASSSPGAYLSWRAIGWRESGDTKSAAICAANWCSPNNAATNSRLAAILPTRMHSGSAHASGMSSMSRNTSS